MEQQEVIANGQLAVRDQATVPDDLPPAAQLDWKSAGSAPFEAKIADILAAPIDDNQLQIKPTGELYLPQIHYRTRLTEAFGVGGWALVPLSPPVMEGTRMQASYVLVCHGRVISEAIGEMEYIASNPNMSTATAKEGAKSDALTRTCKDLSIAAQCWDPDFCADWMEKNAVRVLVKDKKGNTHDWNGNPNIRYRKAGGRPLYNEVQELAAGEEVPPQPVQAQQRSDRQSSRNATTISEPQQKRIFAIAKSHNTPDTLLKEWLKSVHQVEHTDTIKRGQQYDLICTEIENGAVQAWAEAQEPGADG